MTGIKIGKLVEENGRLFVVHNNGDGTETLVPTTKEQLEKKVTVKLPDGTIGTVNSVLLWELHGGPCTTRTIRKGGGGRYPTRPSSEKE